MNFEHGFVNLSEALDFSDEGRVICESIHPYPVVYANKAWTRITEFEQHEVEGKTLEILQGERTHSESIRQMMLQVKIGGYASCCVVNYTKSGTPFFNNIVIQSILSTNIYGEKCISHLLGRIQVIDPMLFISKSLGEIFADYLGFDNSSSIPPPRRVVDDNFGT